MLQGLWFHDVLCYERKAYRNSWTLNVGLWKLDFGRCTFDAGLRRLDSGRWTLDPERSALNTGHCH